MARIRFYIHADPPVGSSLTPSQIEQAILAAARTWQAANSHLRFDYLGLTSQVPVIGDSLSVFAYGGNVNHRTDADGYITEADIAKYPSTDAADSWEPCGDRDGSCVDSQQVTRDVQDTMTHELGHTLGLDDFNSDSDTRWLTMQHNPRPRERFRSTLALGEILALEALYGCACPRPPIYDP